MVDSQEILICPACGNEMKKIFIAEKGINIDICDKGCGGMFFDNQEIREFSSPNEDLSEIKSVLENKNFIPVDEKLLRTCPACKTPMVKTNSMGVQIDSCYNCGGLFLDNGEFEQIRTNFKKRQKVQQIDYNKKSDIDLREFYRDAEEENYSTTNNYKKISKLSRKISRRKKLFELIFDLIF